MKRSLSSVITVILLLEIQRHSVSANGFGDEQCDDCAKQKGDEIIAFRGTDGIHGTDGKKRSGRTWSTLARW